MLGGTIPGTIPGAIPAPMAGPAVIIRGMLPAEERRDKITTVCKDHARQGGSGGEVWGLHADNETRSSSLHNEFIYLSNMYPS